jgi:N-acetylglucosaminyl-diphospho-decaprenol L-rhamnosyltransferase
VSGIGVVVLAYGAGGEYLQVLAALEKQEVPLGRTVVVHNPSAPGEQLPPPPPGHEVIEATHNLGYAAGMNLGIERLLEDPPELLLLLTHDASLRRGALQKLIEAAGAERSYGVLGPVLLLAGSQEAFSFGGTASPSGELGHRKEPPAVTGIVASCDWLDGGTLLVRSAVLDAAGWFDERLWSYCEDADLCLRIRRAGFGVGVVVGAVADQAPGAAKRPGPWAYLRARNGLAFAHRLAGTQGTVSGLLRWAGLALSELARTLARLTPLRPGDPTATWPVAVGTGRGILDFLRGRWGPPPRLPGGGDLRNVEPPDRGAAGG